MVESRLPPGVETPVVKVMKSIALRLGIGSFEIWFELNVTTPSTTGSG